MRVTDRRIMTAVGDNSIGRTRLSVIVGHAQLAQRMRKQTHKLANAQNPLHTFSRNFPVDREAANLLQSCCGLVSDTANKSATSRCNGIRHNTTDATDFYPRQLVTDGFATDLSFMFRSCCGLATKKLVQWIMA